MPSVLFVGSDTGVTMPLEEGDNRISADLEASYLKMAYRGANSIELNTYPQTLVENFAEHISIHLPDVLHIACHGSTQGLWFKSTAEGNEAKLISMESLARVLRYPKDKVVFIDACQSAGIAEALHADKSLRIMLAIGHKGNINSVAAYLGARAFHSQLSRGATYLEALDTMKATVEMIGGTNDQTKSFGDEAFLQTTLLPRPASIIARFESTRSMGPNKRGYYRIEWGACGFTTKERCVVSFFSDDGTLAGSEYTTVESGFPKQGVFWTNDYDAPLEDSEIWSVDGDFNIYMSYTQDGKYAMVKSTLGEALREYYFRMNLPHAPALIKRATQVIEKLR